MKKKISAQPRAKTQEFEGVFFVTINSSSVQDNATERFGADYGDPDLRASFIRSGLITKNRDATITSKGWEQLVRDDRQIETNALAWLRKTFVHARDDGHDRNGDLVGSFWWTPAKKSQLEELEIGINERIDFSDASYGSFYKTAFTKVSRFGANILDGQIGFEQVPLDAVEKFLALHKRL